MFGLLDQRRNQSFPNRINGRAERLQISRTPGERDGTAEFGVIFFIDDLAF